MHDKSPPLKFDSIYHIFNRANGKESLFLSDDNYKFFLAKFKVYIFPIAETYCYCLMPNHFHFLIKIREEKTIKNFFNEKYKLNDNSIKNPEELIAKQFGNFFNSYAKAFNKQIKRKGNLFMHNFKRIKVNNEIYLRKVIHYIHYNPIEAGLTDDLTKWNYNSYKSIISSKETLLERKKVIETFEDVSNFIYCHQYPPKITGIEF